MNSLYTCIEHMYQSLSTVIEITERQSSNGVFQIISTVRCSKPPPTHYPPPIHPIHFSDLLSFSRIVAYHREHTDPQQGGRVSVAPPLLPNCLDCHLFPLLFPLLLPPNYQLFKIPSLMPHLFCPFLVQVAAQLAPTLAPRSSSTAPASSLSPPCQTATTF